MSMTKKEIRKAAKKFRKFTKKFQKLNSKMQGLRYKCEAGGIDPHLLQDISSEGHEGSYEYSRKIIKDALGIDHPMTSSDRSVSYCGRVG